MNKLFLISLLGFMLVIIPNAYAQSNPTTLNPETMKSLPWNVQRQIQDAMKNDGTRQTPESPLKETLNNNEQELSNTDQSPTASEDQEQAGDTKSNSVDNQENDKGADASSALSKIEEHYRSGYNSELGQNLRQFGYNIFSSASVTSSRLAVPNGDYILGPGDALRIRVWGSDIDANFEGAISKDGTIDVPKIGIVPVTGVKFNAVESVIRKEANKYMQGININVSLQKLRSVEIYVVGSVNNPGLHMTPAFSTILGGLLAGGGIQKTGSLRQIELYRNGKRYCSSTSTPFS